MAHALILARLSSLTTGLSIADRFALSGLRLPGHLPGLGIE